MSDCSFFSHSFFSHGNHLYYKSSLSGGLLTLPDLVCISPSVTMVDVSDRLRTGGLIRGLTGFSGNCSEVGSGVASGTGDPGDVDDCGGVEFPAPSQQGRILV